MGLLESRNYYKPFQYEWAFHAFLLQNQLGWLPEEVPLHEDVKDWNTKLSGAEKNLLTQIFRFFTQSDIDVAQGYLHKFIPVFGHQPELAMMMSAFANMEAVHIHAYSLLIDTVGLPEAEYQAFAKYKEMADKHKYIELFSANYTPGSNLLDWYERVALGLAVYSAFTEGLQLFSSFAILLNFTRFGKMKGMGQIITWSVRDESLHVEYMTRLFRTFITEHPEIWVDNFKQELYNICRKMVELEDAFIDLAFEQGGIEGLTAEEVKQYVRYLADRRLLQLGLKPNYGVKSNPLGWLDTILNGVEHTNFFENRSTEYSKGSLTGDWGDVWGKKIA